ncbi:MAG TPA: MarR family transcriptional regulator [Arsenicitalea sp.]|nr:MarR family transcriptional regulator [Arsenicitalea sp.]
MTALATLPVDRLPRLRIGCERRRLGRNAECRLLTESPLKGIGRSHHSFETMKKPTRPNEATPVQALRDEDVELEQLRPRLTALYNRLGFKIRRVHQIAQAIFADACADLGITTTQYGLMYALNELGPLDQITIARLIGLDRSTTGLVVGLLEKRNILSRRPSVEDGRRRILHLTSAGQEMFAKLERPAERSMVRLLDSLSTRERRQLTLLLTRLVDDTDVPPDLASKSLRLKPLLQRPGFLIRRAHQRSAAVFSRECKDLQLTSTQYGVLQVLDKSDLIDQVTLARLIAVDRSTIALVISLLISRGSIAKVADTHDRRRRLLSLTEAGRELLAAANPLAQRALDNLNEVYSDEERAWLLKALDRIISRHEARFSTVPDSTEVH